VGTGCPFGTFAWHVPEGVSQYWLAVQSASTAQPPAGMQSGAFGLHVFERQTVPPVLASHGPSPFAYPQALSFVSHAWLWQTRAAALAVQLPSSTGFVCLPSTGIAVPLASCAVHVDVVSSHHEGLAQSASVKQPPVGSQKPVVLHAPERHTPALLALHGPSPTA
jgi:hypothetical protein